MKKGVDYIGVGCGAMVFNNEGKVFLSKRGKKSRNEIGKWDFPGGGVDFGEKCEDAIKREIKEEHDIEIEVIELLEFIDHIIPEEKQHWVSPSFVAKLVSGEAKIMEPEKSEEIKWEELSNINPETLSAPSKSNFNKYIEKHGYNAPNK
jgi:8-oxo-dGTP diphosphatase